MNRFSLLFTVALGSFLSSAFGQAPEGKVEAAFKLYDRNGDGFLSREETGNPAWFDRVDENKDGQLSLDEVRHILGPIIERRGYNVPPPPIPEAVGPDPSLKEQPELLKGNEVGVARQVPDLVFKDLAGSEVRLAAKDRRATVIASVSGSCPLSNKFAPELARIEAEYAARGVTFLVLDPQAVGKEDQLAKYRETFGLKAPATTNGPLARALNVTTTTEVFVLDASRTLRYRGAINDQYGLGYSKDAPAKNYLREALDAVLTGNLPSVSATSAPGCVIDLPKSTVAAAATAPTYYREISRIVQANCLECHREGGIAPFGLETYAEVVEHAGMIRKQVDRGAMPPWFASKETSGAHAIFANDRSLAEADRATLLAWIKSDRPQGNPADAPQPRTFPTGWTIGQPDAVFQIPQPIQIKAEGTMPYQWQVVETSFPEDRWVQAYEILPTAREVVHHVIVKVHPKGEAIAQRDGGNDGFFAAYVPGNTARVLPEGFAKRLPAGAKISFQIHYTPNGKATQDQIKIGLIFAKEPPRNEVHVASITQVRLNIPPGEANCVVTKDQVVPFNMNVTAYMAHMHVRGKAFKYELTTPDGKTETLLDIPRYDFNWQLQYNYAQPKFIPRGSTVKITAVFDNSPGNPANPDPTKTVHWGPQTFDEMMIGYVEYYTVLPGVKVAAK